MNSIRHLVVLLLAVAATQTLFAADVSNNATAADAVQIIYIDGAKYIVHSVVRGDTLYSLSQRYGVSIEKIVEANPSLSEGLKAGSVIRVPMRQVAEKAKRVKRSKKEFDTHVVKRGETLYSISRRYSIAVPTLMEDNSIVTGEILSTGRTLYIRRSKVGQTSAEESRRAIEEQRTALNRVAVGEYAYHVVHEGESAESIAKRFAVDVEALMKLNAMESAAELREGLIIKVPKNMPEIERADSVQQAVREQKKSELKSFRLLNRDKRAEIALLLPLCTAEGSYTASYKDFYQGFLMGLDTLRHSGINSSVTLYDTAESEGAVGKLIESDVLKSADLIVGPVYENELIPMARYAAELGIPIVSPLANLTHIKSGVTFQMSPVVERKYDKVRTLFDERRIVVIRSESVDKEFEAEVMQLIGERPTVVHNYEYEHPSIVEAREKEYARAEAAGLEVTRTPSPGDLSPLLSVEDESVVVILAGNEIETDRILAALASAKISLRARQQSVSSYVVLGNSRWSRYRNIDRSLLFSNSVTMISTYHVDRSDVAMRQFISKYIAAYGELPSLFAYRGYDSAVVFGSMLYDASFGSEHRTIVPLQTPYRFEPLASGVRANSEWAVVTYNPNFTLTIR